MGTGTWSGGSGGLGTSGSRMSTGSSPKGLKFFLGKDRDATLTEAQNAIAGLSGQRSMKVYLQRMAESPALQMSFAALFTLKDVLLQQNSWGDVQRQFGVVDGPGCLMGVARAIAAKANAGETNRTFRTIAALAVESFLTEAVRHDVATLVNGDAAAVYKKLDRTIFERISGYFFSPVVFQFTLFELPKGLPEDSAKRLQEAAELRANHVIDKFKSRFHENEQTPNCDFLVTCAQNADWFVKRMREKIKQ